MANDCQKIFFEPISLQLSLKNANMSAAQRATRDQKVSSALNKMDLVLDIFITTTLLFAKICVVVRCMYCTLPLAAKYRHIMLHCICLVKLIEHMLILVQLKWSSAYQIQCPIHLVSIRVLSTKDESI